MLPFVRYLKHMMVTTLLLFMYIWYQFSLKQFFLGFYVKNRASFSHIALRLKGAQCSAKVVLSASVPRHFIK